MSCVTMHVCVCVCVRVCVCDVQLLHAASVRRYGQSNCLAIQSIFEKEKGFVDAIGSETFTVSLRSFSE